MSISSRYCEKRNRLYGPLPLSDVPESCLDEIVRGSGSFWHGLHRWMIEDMEITDRDYLIFVSYHVLDYPVSRLALSFALHKGHISRIIKKIEKILSNKFS